MTFHNKEKARPAVLKKLSDKAFSVYSWADPLEVYQRGELFYLRGMFQADEMTLEELDKFFCDIADALGHCR